MVIRNGSTKVLELRLGNVKDDVIRTSSTKGTVIALFNVKDGVARNGSTARITSTVALKYSSLKSTLMISNNPSSFNRIGACMLMI